MRLYIVRHGEAEPFNTSDQVRALNNHGIHQAKSLAAYLSKNVQIFDQVLVSTFRRAQETFAEIAPYYPEAPVNISDQITPDNSVKDALRVLAQCPTSSNVLMVSHMPLVSALCAALVTGNEQQMMQFAFSTAGLAIIETDDLSLGNATLVSLQFPPYA